MLRTENNIKFSLVVASLIALGAIAYFGKIAIWDFLFQLILIITSIILTLWYVDLGQPRLQLRILDPQKVYVGNRETLFLKLSVLNRPQKNIPFISRNTAFACHGSIEFMDANRKLIFSMPIRWSNNPQPIIPEVDQGKVITLIDPSLIRASRYIDIPADENEELDVCYRAPGEKIAIGWNSDSYWIAEGRFPDRMLTLGDYVIKVTIQYNSGTVETEFVLHNPETIDEYKLALPS